MSTSYWLQSTETTTYPQLSGDISADVVVVGGGIAGLSTAWELTQAGRSVVLLEADRLGTGVTGNTTAKVTSLHTLIYSRLEAQKARLYARSQEAAIGRLRHLVEQLGIECELEERTAYTYVEDPAEVDTIAREVIAASAAGLAAEQVSQTGLPYPVAAAIAVTGQAQFHPRKYLLGLAEAAVRNGLQVFEHTRVTELVDGEPCRVSTRDGHTVSAAEVVVATHFPPFSKLMAARLTPRRDLVIAAPIPASADPEGMYITSLGDDVRSVRTAPYQDGQRLLIVTGEAFRPGDGDVEARYQSLSDWTRERFGVGEIAYRWAAQDNHTADHLPFTGRSGGKHVHVTTGYGGWGMTNGVAASMLLRAQITDAEPPEWADLYQPGRVDVVGEAAPMLAAAATVGRHFVGDRLHVPKVDNLEHLSPGSGEVVRIGGDTVAAYRDEKGVLHTVLAKCTHMGCLVAFNDAERTWECPCHGSRFGVDGAVLQGPALSPLEPRMQ